MNILQLYSKFRLVFLRLNPNIKIGKPCAMNHSAKLNLNFGGTINIGKCCEIHDQCTVETNGGDVTLGDFCSLNSASYIYGHGSVTIGDYVRIASGVKIISFNHNFKQKESNVLDQGMSRKGIVIHDDTWIGANSIILDGVTLAKGTVIGAGSIVTKSTTEYGIYCGNPAKFIKERYK